MHIGFSPKSIILDPDIDISWLVFEILIFNPLSLSLSLLISNFCKNSEVGVWEPGEFFSEASYVADSILPFPSNRNLVFLTKNQFDERRVSLQISPEYFYVGLSAPQIQIWKIFSVALPVVGLYLKADLTISAGKCAHE